MAALASYTTAASDTCTAPSGLADGDVLVAIVHHVGVIDTTGWTEIVDTTISSITYSALVRTVSGTPPADYTIGVVGDPESNIVTGVALLRATGSGGQVDGTPQISAGSTGGAGAPMTFGSITTATDNALVIGFGPQGSGTPGYQAPFEGVITYNDLILMGNTIAHGTLGVAGSTGTLTMTTSFAYTGGFAFAISGEGGGGGGDPAPRPWPGLLLPV